MTCSFLPFYYYTTLHYHLSLSLSSLPSLSLAMNMKPRKKMMRGFMCHSQATTAVCMIGDPIRPSSVIVPRRPDRTLVLDGHHHHHHRTTKLINNYSHYSRLPVAAVAASARPNRRDANAMMIMPKRDLADPKQPQTTTTTTTNVFQVVVMRVSLHCQGCAGKVKKHLSKMEGVTSFSIDLETKRVTVMGHVSPVGVLQSISKVKKAEFWSSSSSSSS